MKEFQKVYDSFLRSITEDMYVVLSPEDTERDEEDILIGAISNFEFPRCSLTYDLTNKCFDEDLTQEEIDILGTCMREIWAQRQYYSCDLIRMGYTGSDFKMSSQANQLAKLKDMVTMIKAENIHKQRLYKRRRLNREGKIVSNWSSLFGPSND